VVFKRNADIARVNLNNIRGEIETCINATLTTIAPTTTTTTAVPTQRKINYKVLMTFFKPFL
jgi:hypothetical protein